MPSADSPYISWNRMITLPGIQTRFSMPNPSLASSCKFISLSAALPYLSFPGSPSSSGCLSSFTWEPGADLSYRGPSWPLQTFDYPQFFSEPVADDCPAFVPVLFNFFERRSLPPSLPSREDPYTHFPHYSSFMVLPTMFPLIFAHRVLFKRVNDIELFVWGRVNP